MSGRLTKRKCLHFGLAYVAQVGKTYMEDEKCTYLWTVNEFSMITECFASPVFYGGPRNNHSWQLFMDTKNEIDGVDYLSLFLELVDFGHGEDCPDRTVKADYKLSVLNTEGTSSIEPQTKQFHEFEKSGLIGRRKVISLADLLRIVEDDSLKVRCEIWIYDGLEKSMHTGGPSKNDSSENERNKMFKERFVHEFGKLFWESIATDITISTTSGKSFKAHKAILMARSPMLAARLSKPVDGKNLIIPEFRDFNDEIIEGMLQHLYSGKSNCLPVRAEELLKISDKCKVADLKEDCEFVLTDQLNKENAAATLILADNFRAPLLKQKAIAFIQANMEELLKMKSFQDTMKTRASRDVFVDMLFS